MALKTVRLKNLGIGHYFTDKYTPRRTWKKTSKDSYRLVQDDDSKIFWPRSLEKTISNELKELKIIDLGLPVTIVI